MALCDVILDHYNLMLDHYGAAKTVGLARKHIGWYCADLPGSDCLRSSINVMTDPNDVKNRLKAYFLKIEEIIERSQIPVCEVRSTSKELLEAQGF